MAKARTKSGGRKAGRRGIPVARRALPNLRFARGQRAASIGLTSWDEDTLSFEGVLASETPCRSSRVSPDGRELVEVDEVLSMDGIRNVAQLVGAPLLNMHSSYSLQAVVGVIESARVEGTQLVIRARLWDRPDLVDLVDGVRNGILRNMSVGFDRTEETYEERAGQCPLVTVTGWQPAEGSLVAVPADPTAQIRAAGAKPTPNGARRTPPSTTAKRTAAMATRSKPTLAELQANLKRAQAALNARRKAAAKARKKREDEAVEDQDEDADNERGGDDADGERDGDEADGERDGDEADGERDGDDDQDERDGDDEDEADQKKRQRAATIRGLRTVAERRGKKTLQTFDAIRAAGGTLQDLKDVAMAAIRSGGPISSISEGSRIPGNGSSKPALRSFSETAVAKRTKR